MHSPNVDIIVPVWNNLFQTRACLAAILSCSPGVRLVVVDNGSNRETERMLEEFSEPLGENALFVKSDRNVGLVRAINMGLVLSDSDYAVIVRPHVLVSPGWLNGLIDAAKTGIATPLIYADDVRKSATNLYPKSQIETFDVSFSALALKRDMRLQIGNFDEDMDGAEWCLKDYVSRAWSHGYCTVLSAVSSVSAATETVFGSEERLGELSRVSQAICQERWGKNRQYLVYFGKNADPIQLNETVNRLLELARHGHRFTLLLHNSQYLYFKRMGWNSLHSSIDNRCLSRFFAHRDFLRQLEAVKQAIPGVITVCGAEGAVFPEDIATISIAEVAL